MVEQLLSLMWIDLGVAGVLLGCAVLILIVHAIRGAKPKPPTENKDDDDDPTDQVISILLQQISTNG